MDIEENYLHAWACKSLSPLLRFEEISEVEYFLLEAAFQKKTFNQEVATTLTQIVPNVASLSPKNLSKDEARAFSKEVGCALLAMIYAFRRGGDFSQKEIEKSLQVQRNPLFISLRNAQYEIFDVNQNMGLMFTCLRNPIALHVIEEVIPTTNDPKNTLQIIRCVLSDFVVQKMVLAHEESEDFSRFFRSYLKLSCIINHPVLYEGIVPPLGGKLKECFRRGNHVFIELYEDQVFHIRKDIALSICITVPKVMQLEINPETLESTFVGKNLPTTKTDTGNYWLGSVQRFRPRAKSDIKKDGKHIETFVTLGYGVSWALKLLGMHSDSFNVAHSTLWWYFQTIFQPQEDP